jgi:hypothetical protein
LWYFLKFIPQAFLYSSLAWLNIFAKLLNLKARLQIYKDKFTPPKIFLDPPLEGVRVLL